MYSRLFNPTKWPLGQYAYGTSTVILWRRLRRRGPSPLLLGRDCEGSEPTSNRHPSTPLVYSPMLVSSCAYATAGPSYPDGLQRRGVRRKYGENRIKVYSAAERGAGVTSLAQIFRRLVINDLNLLLVAESLVS